MNIFDSIMPEIKSREIEVKDNYTPVTSDISFSTRKPQLSFSSLDNDIASVESGGSYTAQNPHSSAVGKYQFLWNTWKDKIQNVTGVSSKQEFRSNPDAQEQFYSWYKDNSLMPAVNRLKVYNKELSNTELAKLVHFKGEAGAKLWLINGADNTTAHNISIPKYLSHHGDGGKIPTQAQVNDPSMDAISKVLLWRNRDKNFVDRVIHPALYPKMQTNTIKGYENMPNDEYSTMLMAYDTNKNGTGSVYPTIVQKAKGTPLTYIPGDEAWDYKTSTGEQITTPSWKVADYFSNRGYKNASNQMYGTKYGSGGPVNSKIKIVDPREKNSWGEPLKNKRTGEYDMHVIKDIAIAAKRQGNDPYTALAIGLQESGLGTYKDNAAEENWGQINWSQWNADKDLMETLKKNPDLDESAVALNYILKKKSSEVNDNNEAVKLQAYNGFLLKPNNDIGAKTMYGIDLTKYPKGYDLKKDPRYGNAVIDLRENLIKKNPELMNYVNSVTNDKSKRISFVTDKGEIVPQVDDKPYGSQRFKDMTSAREYMLSNMDKFKMGGKYKC